MFACWTCLKVICNWAFCFLVMISIIITCRKKKMFSSYMYHLIGSSSIPWCHPVSLFEVTRLRKYISLVKKATGSRSLCLVFWSPGCLLKQSFLYFLKEKCHFKVFCLKIRDQGDNGFKYSLSSSWMSGIPFSPNPSKIGANIPCCSFSTRRPPGTEQSRCASCLHWPRFSSRRGKGDLLVLKTSLRLGRDGRWRRRN